jgi:hypothetical protein
MTPNQIKLVQASFAQVVPIAATAADLFYGRLFEIAPHVRPMFPEDLSEQKKGLMAMLGTVVAGLRHLDTLVPAVSALGRRLRRQGPALRVGRIGAVVDPGKKPRHSFHARGQDAWTSAYILLWMKMTDAAKEEPMAA